MEKAKPANRGRTVCIHQHQKILKQSLEARKWVLVYMQLILDYTMVIYHTRGEYTTIMIYHTRGEYATIMIYHTRGEYATIMIYHTRGEYTTIMIYHTRGEYATITSMLYLLLLLCIYLFLWFVQKFFFFNFLSSNLSFYLLFQNVLYLTH